MAEARHIIEWQKSVSPDRGANEPPLVAHLYKTCSAFYAKVLIRLEKESSINKSTLLSLKRSHSYLALWADGYSVTDGSLDASLDKSRRAKHLTIHHLSSVCEILTKRLTKILSKDDQTLVHENAAEVIRFSNQLSHLGQQDNDSDSGSDTSSESLSVLGASELEEIAEDIRTDTECLLDLGSRFGEKAVGPIITEIAAKPSILRTWDPKQTFIDRIRWRYPDCDPWLTEVLGRANWDRVLRYQEQRKASNGLPLQPEVNAGKQADTTSDSTAMASTTFHDSALGGFTPSAGRAYTETVVSYEGGQGDSVRLPQLPEGARRAVPFVCIGCGDTITILSKRAWKKHLFSDLQPYICVYTDCTYTTRPFSTKNDWETHMVTEHTLHNTLKEYPCPICKDEYPGLSIEARNHVALHLEEIALTILPTNPDSEDGTDIDSGLASSDTSSASTVYKQKTAPESGKQHRPSVTDWTYHIQTDLLAGLLADQRFKAFHSIINRVSEELHMSTVLRDIERNLLTQAQLVAPTPGHFQLFSEAVMSFVMKMVSKSPNSGLTREGEIPYDMHCIENQERQIRHIGGGMEIALVEYGSFPMTASIAENEEAHDHDGKPGVHGETSSQLKTYANMERKEMSDEQLIRLLECKESGCEKQFNRPCDLLQHEKTHTRPWKCLVPTCKYYEFGWPTEKELIRHVNNKHSEGSATFFECHFKPCHYKSKRESNCKRHMEKSHGWVYVRTKHKGKKVAETPNILNVSDKSPESTVSEFFESMPDLVTDLSAGLKSAEDGKDEAILNPTEVEVPKDETRDPPVYHGDGSSLSMENPGPKSKANFPQDRLEADEHGYYACLLCPFRPKFSSAKDLRRHYITSSAHSAYRRYYRCCCGSTTARIDNHRRHLRLCHRSASVRYECICGEKHNDLSKHGEHFEVCCHSARPAYPETA